MHMADAMVTPAVAATMYLCTGVAGAYSIKKYDWKTMIKQSL